jgi:hypothetical protein
MQEEDQIDGREGLAVEVRERPLAGLAGVFRITSMGEQYQNSIRLVSILNLTLIPA